MRPPANSASTEPIPGNDARPAPPAGCAPAPSIRRRRSRLPAVLAAACAGLLWAGGCAESEWPDREPLVVDRVPVDSLEFLPPGARFALVDSLTPVLFRGFRTGYAVREEDGCTEVRILELEERAPAAGRPGGFSARVSLRLPADAACPVDTAPRDSVHLRRFARGDGPTLRLLDTLGGVLDSAALVRGVLAFDSLVLAPPAKSITRYRFAYRDTSGALPPVLSVDSLNPCEFLNHADLLRAGDTVRVRYSWVTLDPAPANDSCRGPVHADFITPLPR